MALFFLVLDLAGLDDFFAAPGEGDAMELFFVLAEEPEVVVEVSPLLFWHETKKARPRTQAIEVRRDFFIGGSLTRRDCSAAAKTASRF